MCRVVLTTIHSSLFFFFFNDTATTEIYTLSLHDALPICLPDSHLPRRLAKLAVLLCCCARGFGTGNSMAGEHRRDRKSTRLNSSHANISYAVFCLKKKK